MRKLLAMLALLLGTGGTAMADDINAVVRSWNDAEKRVIVKTETHSCEDISGWSDSGWPTMDGSQREKWYYGRSYGHQQRQGCRQRRPPLRPAGPPGRGSARQGPL